MEKERTLWVKKRLRQGASTRRIASGSEQGDYVESRLAQSVGLLRNKNAGVAELADAQDLGSCVYSCRFKSCHPYQESTNLFRGLSILLFSRFTKILVIFKQFLKQSEAIFNDSNFYMAHSRRLRLPQRILFWDPSCYCNRIFCDISAPCAESTP